MLRPGLSGLLGHGSNGNRRAIAHYACLDHSAVATRYAPTVSNEVLPPTGYTLTRERVTLVENDSRRIDREWEPPFGSARRTSVGCAHPVLRPCGEGPGTAKSLPFEAEGPEF